MIKLLSVAIIAGLISESTQQPAPGYQCWTRWFNGDNPGGSGDFETLANLHRVYPGQICSNPLEIEVTTRYRLCAHMTGEVFFKKDTKVGFICRNKDQTKFRRCQDYRVRFRCPVAFCQGCWTPWSDRDNPSGKGDWEDLYNLHREYPGKICSNPVGIEARTLTGLSPAAAGNVIFQSDTTAGFICRNKDQPGNKKCSDYRVRFRCPAAFCKGCYTQYFDRDNPGGVGDFEILAKLRQKYPGKICSNPLGIEARTVAGLSAARAGDVIHKTDTSVGFVCRNRDQRRNKRCSDYKVRFRCPASFCKGCYTQYFDRDNPSGTGDWETLYNLHREYPGQICSNPVGIEVTTLTGLSPAATGNVIFQSDPTSGFVCRNQDQPPHRRCQDYRVRFRCPADFCDGCYTQYFDRDNPGGKGDFEILSSLRTENPGKICPNPVAIEARTVAGLTPAAAGDVISRIDTTVGFVCRNQDQTGNKRCSDYKVRFRCPAAYCKVPAPGCYTQYFDRDNPGGTGDWEILFNLHREYPGKICSNPIAIEAVTLGGLTPAATGDVIYKSDTTVGFVCRIIDQPNNRLCQDYRVRFRCPADFCDGCYTQYFDRDNPGGKGDFEILSSLRTENPGKICPNPVAIEARTVAGLTPAAAGDVISRIDTTVGFVCRNQDQTGNKRCSDYKVRFRCPAAYCKVPAPGCYTQYFDRDNPGGTGDWEILFNLHREYPGKICSNPIAIEAVTLGGLTPAATGDVIYKSDTTVGFVCRIIDQPNNRLCQDYRVRFRCPADFCDGCYTQYFDRDNPGGKGDFEILSSLRTENPGKICPNPVAIEARTVAGLTPAAAGDVISRIDTTVGFVCRNQDQTGNKRCSDYKVRFRCPAAYCKVPAPGCYTQYFDRDNPGGTGDWEILFNLHREYPGKICSNPIAIEAVTLGGLTPAATGDVIYKSDTTVGFVCRIIDQPNNRLCQDYKVRFRCPQDFCDGCWTGPFDRDNPGGTGDWEILPALRTENPGKICPNPVAIEATTLTGLSPAAAGNVILKNDATTGFVCRNQDQPGNKRCSDYKVRFRCPAAFCKVPGPECYTQYFDRDNPSGTGDWEILSHLRPENPGKICSNPIAIDVKTLTGLSPTTTGEVFFKNDATTGFVCRNQDQKNKRCSDYKVRFRCPAAFCKVPGPECYTQYFDRDNPSGTGDWEILSHLRPENPGKICSNPIAIDVKTLTGLSPTTTGEVFFKNDATTGFVCRNQDQKNKRCSDYKVRFRCQGAFCKR
ncbi:uncharacterized protein LOC141756361 isoform X2 [Sebastes fasciatus]|uniref:uncharacterized protein LOC141756361 isoform X2 n=1 Tax=Sebastes fasciatus TaxID=394691 RepID=UPI003D9E3A4C